jgi:hypothetical protein
VRVSGKGSLIEIFAGHLLYSGVEASTHREFVLIMDGLIRMSLAECAS